MINILEGKFLPNVGDLVPGQTYELDPELEKELVRQGVAEKLTGKERAAVRKHDRDNED